MSALLDSISNLSSNVLSLLLPKRTKKMSLWVTLTLSYIISLCQWSTCSSSISNSNTITSEQGNFIGYVVTTTYSVVAGPVSNSLYYLYFYRLPSFGLAIRKVNTDGSLAWMAAIIPFDSLYKSLTIDASEKYVYAAYYSSILDVVRFNSSTGAIVDAQHQ